VHIDPTLQCPACLTPRRLVSSSNRVFDDPDLGDDLTCLKCDATFPIVDGMPMLFVQDHTWVAKQRESDGWVAYNEEMWGVGANLAEPSPVDFVIPYIADEPWASYGKNFDAIVEGLPLVGRSVLDVGAGRPWAAKEFARRGARATAMDVTSDRNVGLGRGWAMMDEAGVEFKMFVGDSERIPIASDEFDYVFISAAMHHTNFLRLQARELARVLRPGGLLLVANEPTRAATEDEADLLLVAAEPELRHGITERLPTTAQYLTAVRSAGLELETVFLDHNCAEPAQIWRDLQRPVLIPPRNEWLSRGGPRRIVAATRARLITIWAELELRSALPRGTKGIRMSHAQMMAAVYGRVAINLRARKPSV